MSSASQPETVLGTHPVHGFLGNPAWPLPHIAVECYHEARPDLKENTRAAHEYEEDPVVFRSKVSMLARMIMASKNCIAYTGAGISTGAGVPDYASKTAGKRSQVASLIDTATAGSNDGAVKKKKKSSLFDQAELAAPTKAHMVLFRTYQAGWLKWWCQQNHDGLPQKAGVPQEIMNEIHGSWFDPTNRVINFSEDIRRDLYEDLRYWERTADLCLAVGTSLSGMNSDRIAISIGEATLKKFTKFQKKHKGPWDMDTFAQVGGTVIIGFQCTRVDDYASLRIYSTIDRVFEALAEELIRLSESSAIRDLFSAPYEYDPQALVNYVKHHDPEFAGGRIIDEDIYEFDGYDPETGKMNPKRSTQATKRTRVSFILDLRVGQRVQFLVGQDKDCFATVVGKDQFGHYKLDCEVMCRYRDSEGYSYRRMGISERTLGLWMIISALEGRLPWITMKNAPENASESA